MQHPINLMLCQNSSIKALSDLLNSWLRKSLDYDLVMLTISDKEIPSKINEFTLHTLPAVVKDLCRSDVGLRSSIFWSLLCKNGFSARSFLKKAASLTQPASKEVKKSKDYQRIYRKIHQTVYLHIYIYQKYIYRYINRYIKHIWKHTKIFQKIY